MRIKAVISIEEIRKLRAIWHKNGESVAFVPTMGALHDGHLGLVLKAKELSERTIVSIFVNPKQFGPQEDFARYPRTLAEDLEKLETLGADAVFMPNAADIYPDHFYTYIQNTAMSGMLCGLSRPGHFTGVLTVVTKLFNLVEPHIAIFGKKDYQQWRLIEQMVRDLNMNLQVVGMETARETDGMAMSSRNRFLGTEERSVAANIFQGLNAAKAKFASDNPPISELIKVYQDTIKPFDLIKGEYAEIRRQDNLQLFADDKITAPAVFLVAAKINQTRLIDNIELHT